MNFLKVKTTWSNAEFAVFKICVASAYALVGAYFHNFIRENYVIVLAIFAISVVATILMWRHKMKKEN